MIDTATLNTLIKIRRHLHSIPEIGLREHKTAECLSDFLKALGLEVTTGIAGTGIVATLQRGSHPVRLGLRADMDALPIQESATLDYHSRHQGCMHACGHDGHMAMLLGAAQVLSQDNSFEGTVHFIFQPAEETIGGARLMIEDGLFERFPCDMVFGLHNIPGFAVGSFSGKPGPLMASIDAARIVVKGKGGHGAEPEKTIDPIVIGAQIVSALQSVVARNLNPLQTGVVTVGSFHSGSASNIIADGAVLEISTRAVDSSDRAIILKRVEDLVLSISRGFGGDADINWLPGYPALINDQKAFELATEVVAQTFGCGSLQRMSNPIMPSEDFAFMLERVPGAFLFIGNGESAALHNSAYNFNDDVIPYGVAFYRALAERVFS